jgi:DNA-binding XRE family transcriptional regulator
MTPERQARIRAASERLAREMPLNELRAARAITQEQLAQTLGVKQHTVSRLERRTDMYISSLAKVVEAMGGRLEIRAVFPDGAVAINQFSAVDEEGVNG